MASVCGWFGGRLTGAWRALAGARRALAGRVRVSDAAIVGPGALGRDGREGYAAQTNDVRCAFHPDAGNLTPAAALARRRALPAGGVGSLVLRDGWRLRTAAWPARAGGPGSILLVSGRGDFLEKNCETFHDLIDAGWGVASFDWRGQGLSGRQGDDPMKGHSPGFANWRADLGEVVAWFKATLPPPWHVVAHSMGGNLTLRHLEGGNHDFARAVLLSPMLGVRAKPLGPWLARRLARLMVAIGRGGDFLIGGGPYVPGTPGTPRQALLTSDAERYVDEGWWTAQTPGLALGSATWGWLDAAYGSIAQATTAAALGSIVTPLLVLIPTDDGLVDNAATHDVVPRILGARIEVQPGTGHELLREADALRSAVLARLTRFLKDGA